MERTNYVAKAKSLMMSAARTTALVIVPLAAAVNAHASSVALPTTNFACTPSISGGGFAGSCSGSRAQLDDLGSGVQGISFYASAAVHFALSSGSGSTLSLTMQAGGTSTGAIPLGTLIPLAAQFSLTPNGGATITDWQLLFSLGTSAGDGTYGSTLISCATSGTCSGGDIGGILNPVTSVLAVTSAVSGGSQLWETVRLTVLATGSQINPSSVDVSVPSSSWDFQSVAATSAVVPESSTLALIGSGLALGLWFRRRQS